jgi:hypothetical protein
MGALEDILQVRIEGYEVILSGLTGELPEQLHRLGDEVRLMEDRLQVRVGTRERVEALLAFAFANKLELISVNPVRPSLEDHFQSVVGTGSAGVPPA